MHSPIFRIWLKMMKDKGFAYEDQGALVVDVREDTDTKEIPPCMLLKSDGASLYTTTDSCNDCRASESFLIRMKFCMSWIRRQETVTSFRYSAVRERQVW